MIAQDKIAKQLMQQRIMIRTALRLLRATLDRQVSSSEIKRLQIAENTLTQQLQTANSKFDQTEGGMAFNQLLEANLRLVMSFVRNKTDYDVPLEDIIQEGNIGLMRAAEKFDPKKGFKFSTYARWWIRQAVNRVLLAERNIALPVYIVDNIDALHKVEASLCQELGRYPTTEEIGMVLNITGEQVKELRLYEKDTLSMEMPYGEDDTTLGDVIADQQEEPPLVLVDSQDKAVVNDTVNYALSKLTASEQEVIRWRYGIGVPGPLTLIKIGEKMGITRERVRQLEERALKKLQGEQPAGRTRTA